MKLAKILCADCKEKVREYQTKEKRVYRLKIKQGRQVSGKVKIKK